MNLFQIARFLAVFISLPIIVSLHPADFTFLFGAFLFAHITTAIIYSRRYFLRALSVPTISLILLLIATLILTISNSFPLMILYFAIHTVFNDTYILKGKVSDVLFSDRNLLLTRMAWAALAYVVFLRQTIAAEIGVGSTHAIIVVLSVALLSFLFAAYRARKIPYLKEVLVYESAVIPFVLFSFLFKQVSLIHAIFYHLAFWLILPLLACVKSTKKKNYLFSVAAQLCLFIGYWLLGTYFGWRQWINDNTIHIGYIHVSTTFFTSQANPAWVLALFLRRTVH